MRIDEVSEEESYKFSYMSSSLLKKVWKIIIIYKK